MKSVFIFLFSLNFFTSGILFGEFARIVGLVEHFQVHCKENPDTTITEFIRLHYFDSSHQNDASHNHHNLPFHHHCGQAGGLLICCTLPAPVQEMAVAMPLPAEQSIESDFYYHRFIPTGFVGNLFQPPKA